MNVYVPFAAREPKTRLADELGAARDGPLVVDCKVNHLVKHRSKQ